MMELIKTSLVGLTCMTVVGISIYTGAIIILAAFVLVAVTSYMVGSLLQDIWKTQRRK